jgi:hypothetical protein
MQTIQMRARRAATGGRFRTAQLQISDCRLQIGQHGTADCGLQSAKAEGLSDRNTFFICDTDERGSGLEENLRLSSRILAYLRLMGEKC